MIEKVHLSLLNLSQQMQMGASLIGSIDFGAKRGQQISIN